MAALILMYHSISESDVDPWSICVSPERFSRHMSLLRKVAQPCSLGDLVAAHQKGRIPENAVAVTFDDGYSDNLTAAKPILEQQNIPATVFACSGQIGQRRDFWWDELQRALLTPMQALPRRLQVGAGDMRFSWDFEDETGSSGDAGWGTMGARNPNALPRSAFLDVYHRIRTLPADELASATQQISAWSGNTSAAGPLRPVLDEDGLAALTAGGLVDIGAHSVSHALLPAHPREMQMREILGSKSQLEAIIEGPVDHFAFPYGEYDRTSLEIVRGAGFASACTNSGGTVTPESSLHELPRLAIEDWNGEQFVWAIQNKLGVARCNDVGSQMTIPLGVFKRQTGALIDGIVECRPGEHVPGHCLYGGDFIISESGTYQAVLTMASGGATVDSDDVVFDVFENKVTKTVFAEMQPDPATWRPSPPNNLILEFSAEPGYRIEFRVYWRGRSLLRLDEVRMERLS